jgi:hypothetical protein
MWAARCAEESFSLRGLRAAARAGEGVREREEPWSTHAPRMTRPHAGYDMNLGTSTWGGTYPAEGWTRQVYPGWGSARVRGYCGDGFVMDRRACTREVGLGQVVEVQRALVRLAEERARNADAAAPDARRSSPDRGAPDGSSLARVRAHPTSNAEGEKQHEGAECARAAAASIAELGASANRGLVVVRPWKLRAAPSGTASLPLYGEATGPSRSRR